MKYLNKPLKIVLLAALLCLCLCMGVFAAEAEIDEVDAVTEASIEENASAFLFDLDDAENPDELAAMIDKGYIVGYSDGSFRPGRSYTRVELAQLVTALCELDANTATLPAFYDTEIYAKDAIDAAVSNSLMTGRTDTSFDPYGEVLKAELVSTLDKAAVKLGIENFYELLGEDIGWASDYTICTAAEAMHVAYALDTAVTEARDAALKDAAALLAAMASEEPDVELVFEPADSTEEEATVPAEVEEAAETAEAEEVSETAETEEAPVVEAEEYPAETDEAAEESETESSGEPSAEASGEASGEASEEPKEEENAEQSAPPAGVTTPAGSQPAQQPAPVSPAAPAQTDTTEALEGEHIIIQKVVDFYNTVRDNIVDILSGVFA